MKAEMGKEQIAKETILEQLNWRYATKSYDQTKKISAEDWETLEQALILAPSSFGIQPYKFLVIGDPELREKLKAAAYGQPAVTDASEIVVFAYKKNLTDADIEHFVERIVEVRGTPRESLADYENAMKNSAKNAREGGYIETWNSRQAYIALGFFSRNGGASRHRRDADGRFQRGAVQRNFRLGRIFGGRAGGGRLPRRGKRLARVSAESADAGKRADRKNLRFLKYFRAGELV